MKYIKLYPTLVFSFILSSLSVTSSAIEETITYGTAPSPWGIDPSLKQVPSTGRAGGSNGGTSYTPPEARAAIAAGQKAMLEGQKEHCEHNKARIFSENRKCLADAQETYSTATGKCTTDSNVSITLGFISATTERHRICIEQSGRELKTNQMKCEAKQEFSMCRGLGIL